MKYPNWKGLTKPQRNIAIKYYKEFQKAGKTYDYSVRIAGNKARGRSTKEARGYHKAERYLKRGTAYKPAPKGRLDTKKEAWGVYAYQDSISRDNREMNDSEILAMSTYDVTKTQYKNYDEEALFAMHMYFERIVQDYLKMDLELSFISDLHFDDDLNILMNQPRGRRIHRNFEFQLTDIISGEVQAYLVYEKGVTIVHRMWEDFNYKDFKINIRELKIWE